MSEYIVAFALGALAGLTAGMFCWKPFFGYYQMLKPGGNK